LPTETLDDDPDARGGRDKLADNDIDDIPPDEP
jgi:hypothetical protein